MATPTPRMNGPFTGLLHTLLLITLLNPGAVNCESDFIDDSDRQKVEDFFDLNSNTETTKGNIGVMLWDDTISGSETHVTRVISEDQGQTSIVDNESTMAPDYASSWTHNPNMENISPHIIFDNSWTDSSKFPSNKDPIEKIEIHCVNKESISNRDAIKVHLNYATSCEDTKLKIKDVIEHICSADCKIEIYQEPNSDQVMISGETVEVNVDGVASKLKGEGLKKKLGVKEAVPHWSRRTSAVFVSLLVTGLLLAALLLGAYVVKNHRGHKAKGMTLAEKSFPIDEEGQGNTLVSVAPLQPQEMPAQEKPSINGESPDGGKSQAPPTNGHQTPKSPMADTEL